MNRSSEIREFLVSRRARITPDRAGLPAYGGTHRRVKGLRREEAAMLAGVSVDYYTRLEPGNLTGASESVLDAVARALQLDEAERAHLFDRAHAANASPATRRRSTLARRVRPGVQRVLDAMTEAPAWVRNGRADVLATNQPGPGALRADVGGSGPATQHGPVRVPVQSRPRLLPGVGPHRQVIVPFAWSDGTCDFCREGLQTSCRHGGFWNANGVGGMQAEALRVPLADGTLVPVPVGEDSPLLPSLLTLSDVYGTGYHAAVQAHVTPHTTVTVIGDGAVGLMAVLSAKRLGAEWIILMGRHTARTDLGRDFGATDVIAERGEEGIAAVRELSGGDGTHVVLEAVGHMPAYQQAIGVVRAGGVISRVGVPQYEDAPVGFGSLFGRNITLTGGPAPARAYIETLVPDILDGTVEPGRVFDRIVDLNGVPEGYQAMDDRQALKVLVTP